MEEKATSGCLLCQCLGGFAWRHSQWEGSSLDGYNGYGWQLLSSTNVYFKEKNACFVGKCFQRGNDHCNCCGCHKCFIRADKAAECWQNR